jgi:hypothetical protein
MTKKKYVHKQDRQDNQDGEGDTGKKVILGHEREWQVFLW